MPDPVSNVGHEADKVLKPKVSVRVWVILAVAAVANAVGVFLHI